VPGSPRLVDLVQSAIDELLDREATTLAGISPDLGDLNGVARSFLAGGKRFRALFCYWGWQAVAGRARPDDLLEAEAPDPGPVVDVAAALEVFHAAALVHDDIIDNSDTRRGAPAAHRAFEALHRESGWAGDGAAFGRAAGILHGDLLLGWSDELLDEALELVDDRSSARRTRLEFNRMRTEVTGGQYLDILEERAWPVRAEEEFRSRAETVITYKSAKYSVLAPLVIGAAAGGGSDSQLASLRSFGLPLGMAYQLRDDLLGVFGDSAVTGKPSGDDLREGKRTMLIAIARERLPLGAQRLLDELLGDPELDEEQIRLLQSTIRDSGAVDEVEALIARHVVRATTAMTDAPLTRRARRELAALAETVTRRAA
jgi:geranylgeranyl diphosphate synthase type I